MTTARQSLENFKAKLDDLVNAKYILAERKISELLKTVADSKMLYELFEYVSDGFDYKTFKSVCFPENGGGVKLPVKDSDAIALCFLLFVEIDGGGESLDSFCEKNFGEGESSLQGRYSRFVLKVVIPFGLIVEKVANKLIIAQEEGVTTSSEEESESVDKPSDVQSSAEKTKREYPFIRSAREKVERFFAKKDGEKREELEYILDCLERATARKDAEGVTLAFTALKYCAASERKLKINLDEISDGISEEASK